MGVLSALPSQILGYFRDIFLSSVSSFLEFFVYIYKDLSEPGYLKLFLLVTLFLCFLAYILQSPEQIEPSAKKVVFITGCDSGLGLSLAYHICDLGFTVIAGCLNGSSEGARLLKEYNNQRIMVIQLDVTNQSNIRTTAETVTKYIESRRCELWAIINNAGTMVFGEFEWQTNALIRRQISVNVSGTFKLTKVFTYMLRKHKARLINITSHCAFATLPGLAVYGATKAALLAWNNCLRIEMGKYDVSVVAFVPGNFVTETNIMAQQADYASEMNADFTDEQKGFYGEYFERYNSYLNQIPTPNSPARIVCEEMYKKFDHALLDSKPKTIYVNESWNYKLYHILFKYSPTQLRDYYMRKFVQMPDYNAAEGTLSEPQA